MHALISKITEFLSKWQNRHNGDPYLFYGIAIGMGVLCGMGAAALKGGISFVTDLLFRTLNIQTGNWVFFFLPVVGIFLVVLFTKYLVRAPMDHATERVASDLANGSYILSPRLILGSIVGCSLTLGMGGSAGAESPVAYTGAAIGSNVGRAFKFTADDIRALVGCGAGAGIAGIYMAPIGGVMYALEVLKMRQNLTTVLALTFSCLAAALTSYLLLGCHNDVSFVPQMVFDMKLMPYVIGLGVFCGVYSVYYSTTIDKCSSLLRRIPNIWLRALTGGMSLAAMLFLFPSLYGEGYNIMGKLMDDDSMSIISYSPLYHLGQHSYLMLLLLFVVLLLFKPWATSATNDSGGVGGDFTPTLFCGAVAGYLYAAALNHFFDLHLSYALFAFFGMAAVMSGAKLAPLMGIFIVAEMTGMYGFILPLSITALTSLIVTVLLRNDKLLRKYFKLPPALPPGQ